MKLKYRPAAIDDLQRAADYIEKVLKNPTAAKSFKTRILHGISLLKENPKMGTLLSGKYDGLHTSMRFIVISRQLVFYGISDDIVEVIRILDGRTDYLARLFE